MSYKVKELFVLASKFESLVDKTAKKSTLEDLLSKYSGNPAPSAHTRSWDPLEKETPKSEKPSINHVEGNIGTDRKATDAKPGVGVDSPSHKATDPEVGKGVDAPSHKATDSNSADTRTAGGAPLNGEPYDAPEGNSGSGGNGPSDVRSPTSTEVRSPTSTEVRSPTSTSTEVRSPTSTSTEAYTADNFTATVTGGAGDGANTTVNIYLTPPTTQKINPNIPTDNNLTKDKKAFIMSTIDELLVLAEYFDDLASGGLTITAKEKEDKKDAPKGKRKFPFWLMKKKGPKDSKKPSDSKDSKKSVDSSKPNPFAKKKVVKGQAQFDPAQKPAESVVGDATKAINPDLMISPGEPVGAESQQAVKAAANVLSTLYNTIQSRSATRTAFIKGIYDKVAAQDLKKKDYDEFKKVVMFDANSLMNEAKALLAQANVL